MGRALARLGDPPVVGSWDAAGVLAGTWLLALVTQGYIILPASVLDPIATDTGVERATAVLLISATPGAWALTNFAVGFALDRAGDVRVTTLATLAFVAASLASWQAGAAGAFWPLLGTRLVAGVAIGAIWTAAANIVGRRFSAGTRGTALGVFTTSAPAGFALAQVATPMVAAARDWPAVFAIVAALAGVAYLLFLLGVRGVPPAPSGHATSVRQDVASLLGNRAVLAGCAMAFAAYSLYLFLNSWMPTYLRAEFGLSLGASGLLAAVFPAVGVASRAGGGALSDRLFARRRLPVLRLSFGAALPAVVLLAASRRVAVVALLLVAAGAVIQLTFGVVYSYVRDVVPGALAGTALSFLGTAGISGAFSAPIVTGAIIDYTGSYIAAFAFSGVLAAAGLVLAMLAPEAA